MSPLNMRLFGTDGIRGRVGEWPITKEFFTRLGEAISRVLPGDVIIGKDTRASSDTLEEALVMGLFQGGGDVFRIGVFPTPGIAHLVRIKGADVGAVVSASHNPAYENGIKLFGKGGRKIPDPIQIRIEDEVFSEGSSSKKEGRFLFIDDAKELYTSFLEGVIKDALPLRRLLVVVDCANGCLSWIIPEFFERLGLRVIRLNCEPDGRNINLGCGSLFPEVISRAVLENGADLGFSYDGDGDRVIACTEDGRVLDGDHILSILASSLKEEGELKGDLVVGTVMSNLGLEVFLKEIGIRFIRSKVGDRYVLEEMEREGAILGGEPSGHIIHLGYHTTGDGILTSLLLISLVSRRGLPLSKLVKMRAFPQSILNVRIKERPQLERINGLKDCMDKVKEEFGEKGRVVVRYSGTEDVCRVMVEGPDKEKVQRMAERIASIIKREIGSPI